MSCLLCGVAQPPHPPSRRLKDDWEGFYKKIPKHDTPEGFGVWGTLSKEQRALAHPTYKGGGNAAGGRWPRAAAAIGSYRQPDSGMVRMLTMTLSRRAHALSAAPWHGR